MHRNRILAFSAATFLYWAALYIFLPTLPAFVKEKAPSLAAVGVVLSMFGLWEAILRTPLGVLVDASARKKPYLVGGFLLGGAGALIMAHGTSLGALTFGRALTGASSAVWAPMIAVFSGFFPPQQAVFATSVLALLCSLGQMVATSSTGFLNAVGGYALSFYVSAVLTVAASVILLLIRLPAPRGDSGEKVSPLSILRIFIRRDVLIPSFANAACQVGCWAVIYGFLPLLARQLGAGEVAVSLLVTTALAANTATNLIVTIAARRGGPRWILHGSFVMFGGAILLAAASRSVPLLFAATAGMGAASGFYFPILMGLSIERVDGSHRSTAMGIHQAVYAVGMFVGPWIGGVISDAAGIRAMFVMVGIFSALAPNILMAFHRLQ